MKYYYFAYGMNTNLASMKTRCTTAQVLGPAQLENYRLEFSYHCNVVADSSATTPGLLWEITDSDLQSLDLCEGYPEYYTRDLMPVLVNGQRVPAVVYTMADVNPIEMPSTNYLKLVQQGYVENKIDTSALTRALNKTYELSIN